MAAMPPGPAADDIAVSPDGTGLVAVDENGPLSIWSVGDDVLPVKSFEASHGATAVTWTPDGSGLLVGTGEGRVTFADSSTGRPVEPSVKIARSPITQVSISADGTLVAVVDQAGDLLVA